MKYNSNWIGINVFKLKAFRKLNCSYLFVIKLSIFQYITILYSKTSFQIFDKFLLYTLLSKLFKKFFAFCCLLIANCTADNCNDLNNENLE